MDLWVYIIFSITFCLIILVYLVLIFYLFAKSNRRNKCFERFYNILETLQEKDLPIDQTIKQLFLNYEQLCQDTRNECTYKLNELLTYIVYQLDSTKPEKNYFHKNLKDPKKFRDFVFKLHSEIEKIDPFSFLSDTDASLLNNIKSSFASRDFKVCNNLIDQLASEIKAKDTNLNQTKKQMRIATFISIIGIVLTIFFGILSFAK